MSKHINMKNIITAITGLLFSIILVCLMTLVSSYTKAAPSIIQYNASSGVEYYVSGQYINYDETNRQYSVTEESPVTIGIINNNMIAEVDGTNPVISIYDANDENKTVLFTSNSQQITFTADLDKKYGVTVNTRAISKADHGRSLSDPFIIKSFNEFKVLYKVLAGLTLEGNESSIYGDIFDGASKANLEVSYFKLFDNIIIDMDEYYGLKDFKGVFDFNGYSITLNVTNKEYTTAQHGGTEQIICFGLFSTLENAESAPCVVRNGKVRGSIALTPDNLDTSGKIFVGGIAGKSTGNVFIDRVQTSVSLTADDNTSIYMGGFFGSTSSPVDKHYNLKYNGVHTVLSATTHGANAYAYVGGFAGTIDNTYVTGYTDESTYLTIIANSLSESAGGAVSGGFAGAVNHRSGDLDQISIENIVFKTEGILSVSSFVNNNSDNSSNPIGYACAGGISGVSYAGNDKKIVHGLVQFVEGNDPNSNLFLDVFATNQSSSSQGNTFAGGLYGHVGGEETGINEYKYVHEDTVTIFDCDVQIRSIQNGHDVAKAGGLFGHGAFAKNTDTKLSINLTSERGSISVLAEQTAISNYENTTSPKEVAAGYYTSTLPDNYALDNVDFTVNNGTLVAQRSVGSTIFGAVYAGGFAGSAPSGSSTNQFKNMNIYLNDSTVAGLGLSFESNKSTAYTGDDSNVAVGGFIGYIKNYGNVSVDRDGNESSGTFGIENINIKIDLTSSKDYVIKGVQNADATSISATSRSDHQTEGYVGGLVGFTYATSMKNVSISGDNLFDSLVICEANNSPYSAPCGGLVGANHKSGNFALNCAFVKNISVYSSGYYEGDNNKESIYNTFAGGAVGTIIDLPSANSTIVMNVNVEDVFVTAIGENTMKTFAGGVIGGIKGFGESKVFNSKVYNCEIYSSSLAFQFNVGGISAMCLAANDGGGSNPLNILGALIGGSKPGAITIFENCYVIDCYLSGYSNSAKCSIAGICAELNVRDNDGYGNGIGTKNCFTNAKSYGYTSGELTISAITDNYGGKNGKGTNGQAPHKNENNFYDPINIYGVVEGVSIDTLDGYSSPATIQLTNTTNGEKENSNTNMHTAISGSDKIQSYLLLENNSEVTVYPKALANNRFSISYSGDTHLLTDPNTNSYTIKTVQSGSGTVYANLCLTIDEVQYDGSIINRKYTFASYPIYIHGGSSSGNISVTDMTTGNNISATLESDYYIPVVAGDNEKQQIKISFNGTNPNITLYNPTAGSSDITTLINGCTSSVSSNVFNEKIGIEIFDSYILLSVDENIRTRTVLGLKLGNDYVFVDCTPNYVKSINITASNDTPALGQVGGAYIFAPGDTIVMDGFETYNSGSIKSTSLITYSISGTSNEIQSFTNGRIDIGNVADGYTFTVTGLYVGGMSENNVELKDTYNIVIYSNITVTTNIVGGMYSANRKAVYGQGYTFTVNPNPGFGLSPNNIVITIGTTIYDLTSAIVSKFGERPNSNKTAKVYANNVEFDVIYNNNTGGYTITIPGTAMTGDLDIDFEYALTADIIFDFGYVYSLTGNERYYIYTVKAGTVFNETLYNEIKDAINVSLYGYHRQDYHLTDSATSIESFGSSLGDIVKAGTKIINGPMYFYARWTYEVLIEHPDGITVESTLPIGLLQETKDGSVQLIPISTDAGFTFKIIPDSTYQGTPDFFAYIYNEDGTFTDITKYCSKNELGGYDVDPSVVNGIIYIKVTNENLIFNDGESEAEESVDVEIYGDSIFTINYSINYDKEGVSKDNAVLGNNMSLQFNKALPSGTSIRLYRSYNSSAKDVYVYKLNSESDIIDLSSFINMYNGKTLANSEIIGTSIFNETYYFVVTLPNNKQVTNFLSNNFVQFNVSYEDSGNINVIEYLSEENKGNITVRPDYSKSGLGKVYFHVNQTIGVNVNESNNKLTVSYGDKAVINGEVIEDLRHKDKYYVWEVYNPNGVNVNSSDAVFGKTNFVTNTLSASYYLANGTTAEITSLPSGTIIRLLEVTNTLSPASGVVLYTKTI